MMKLVLGMGGCTADHEVVFIEPDRPVMLFNAETAALDTVLPRAINTTRHWFIRDGRARPIVSLLNGNMRQEIICET